MKNYIDNDGNLYSYDDSVKPSQIKTGLTEMTEEVFNDCVVANNQNRPIHLNEDGSVVIAPNDCCTWDEVLGEFVTDHVKYESEQKEKQRIAYKSERDELLASATVAVDGMIFDARYKDIANLKEGILLNETRWILNDNSIVPVTVEQLQQVYDLAVAQGKSIWDNYMDQCEALNG